jgi:hypothetical protein
MKLNNDSILFIVDHTPDPRIRKRIAYFLNKNLDVYLMYDSRSNWVSGTIDNRVKIINSPLNSDYIYLSGNKVFHKNFFFILKSRLKGKEIVYEIPDLPYRYSRIKNFFIGIIFQLLIFLFTTKIIVTSDAFTKYIYHRDINFIPNISFKLSSTSPKLEKQGGVKIGFYGVIRYINVLAPLLNVFNKIDIIESISIFGGPEVEYKKLSNQTEGDKISYFGRYNYEKELTKILEGIHFSLALYDVSQLNVKLALPNKLYESIFYRVPMIVSKGTYLQEVVEELGIGFAIDVNNVDELYIKQMLSKSYNFDKAQVELKEWSTLNEKVLATIIL